MGVHSLWTANPAFTLTREQADKRRRRGGTAQAAGARFTAFIMSEHGAVGPDAAKLLERLRKDMEDRKELRKYEWWRRRLVTVALKGTYGVAAGYFAALSKAAAGRTRTRRPVVAGQ